MKKQYVVEDLNRMINQGKELLSNMKSFHKNHVTNEQDLFNLVTEDREVRELTHELEKVLKEISI